MISIAVGGLIGINDSWFRAKDPIRGVVDFDSIKTAGAYSLFNIDDGSNNAPTSGWCVMIVFNTDYYIAQLVLFDNSHIKYRKFIPGDGIWSGWKDNF